MLIHCKKINEENTFKQQQIVIWKYKATSSVIPVKADNIVQHFLLQYIILTNAIIRTTMLYYMTEYRGKF